ncbi:peptidase C14 [Gyrodon lividus]|nr:peptidase C14 [Gyrodon lividus]
MPPINQTSPSNGSNKTALLIAVRDVNLQGLPKLYNAHRDAECLRRLLIDNFGYPEDKVIVMMDKSNVPEELWPTKTNIKKQIQLLVRGVSPGDHLFFYYSGHGRQVPCNHHSEKDGLDEVIFACTGNKIKDNDLKKWLVNPLPRGAKLFALWDSCHSETVLDLDHHTCNDPDGQELRQHRDPNHLLAFMRGVPQALHRKGPLLLGRNALTNVTPKQPRGRPVTRASLTLTAVSTENSSTLSKWIPSSEAFLIKRVLSPLSWFKCDGKCEQPPEAERDRAHVISLSACKDSEMAFDDDLKNGTVTKFFIDHLRENPKSTLLQLLTAIRKRVGEISEARQELDMQTKVVSRRATFGHVSESRGKPPPAKLPSTLEENGSDVSVLTLNYSQKPGYASHYRLDLDEPVDL